METFRPTKPRDLMKPKSNSGNKDQTKNTKHGCFLLIGIVLLVIFGVSMCSKCSEEPKTIDSENVSKIDTSSLELSAKVQAKILVTERLVCPSTAKFPWDEPQQVLYAKDSTIIINGVVDSQNSFGAMIRSSYGVKLKWNGKITGDDIYNNWKTLKVIIE